MKYIKIIASCYYWKSWSWMKVMLEQSNIPCYFYHESKPTLIQLFIIYWAIIKYYRYSNSANNIFHISFLGENLCLKYFWIFSFFFFTILLFSLIFEILFQFSNFIKQCFLTLLFILICIELFISLMYNKYRFITYYVCYWFIYSTFSSVETFESSENATSSPSASSSFLTSYWSYFTFFYGNGSYSIV